MKEDKIGVTNYNKNSEIQHIFRLQNNVAFNNVYKFITKTLVVFFLFLLCFGLTAPKDVWALDNNSIVNEETVDIRSQIKSAWQKNIRVKKENKNAQNFSVKISPIKNIADTSKTTANVAVSLEVNTGVGELDLGLNFLREAQTTDGYWNNLNDLANLKDTTAVMDLFKSLNLNTDDAYVKALSWLDKQYYENTLSEALKLSTLAENEQDVLYSLEPLIMRQDSENGGFGYNNNHKSDPLTTAEVLQAISASNYIDYGDNPDHSKIQAIIYLVNSQNEDGGWGDTDLSDSDIFSTAMVLEALYDYRFYTITTFTESIVIGDIINSSLAYLKQAQLSNGSWNNKIFDTAVAYDVMHKFNATLNYENEAFNFLKSSQVLNGSFANENILVTAKALKALSYKLSDDSPDIVITDITPTSNPVNGETFSLDIKMKNIGRGSVSSADIKLYDFTDNYNRTQNGIAFLPAGTNLGPNQEITLTLYYGSTESFLGATTLKYYVEAINDADENNNWITLEETFASSPTNTPAIQSYYVASKHDTASGVKVRWPYKPDPNRSNYAVLFREAGVTAWSGIIFSNTATNVSITGFTEGKDYEVTAGVKDINTGSITYFSNLTLIKPSAVATNYLGNANGLLTLNSSPLANSSLLGYLISTDTTTDQATNFSLNNLQHGSNAFWAGGLENDKIVTKFNIGIGATTSGIRVFTRISDDATPPVAQYVRIKNDTDHIIESNTISTIEIGASDNVNVKEADLSYYNPSTGTWIFIATIPMSGSVSAFGSYNWLVPENLSGADFKLRAVVRDYKGNISIPVEYVPFTIMTPNIPPNISIIKPNGNLDNANTSYTITWTDSDPDSNATISLYYDNDVTGLDGTLIASGISEDNATNEYVWNTASIAKGDYYIYATITDGIDPTVSAYSLGVVKIGHPPLAPTGLNAVANSCGTGTINISWDTTSDATLYSLRDTSTVIYTGATNSFSHINLAPGSNHDYTIRAENSSGNSAYSSVVSKNAPNDCNLPSISTTIPTNITQDSADSGGNITSDGGASITARGIVWSTEINPTTALATKTSDGTGIGAFTSSITGLSAGTLYHVRAYATNSVGTSYGANVTLTTISIPIIDKWDLFIDSLATSWNILKKNVTETVPDTTRFYSGTASMKLVSTKANSQFTIKKILGSENSTGKTTLTFAIQSETSLSSSNFKVRLLNSSGGALKNVQLKSYGPLTLNANNWYKYSIPLADLKGLNKELSGVRFTFSKTGTYYLDELKLE